jgi:hypothetical protein
LGGGRSRSPVVWAVYLRKGLAWSIPESGGAAEALLDPARSVRTVRWHVEVIGGAGAVPCDRMVDGVTPPVVLAVRVGGDGPDV